MSSNQKDFQQKSACVATTTLVLGDKWSPCLVFVLSQKAMGFNALQEHLTSINPRTLSQRLAKLEATGIINKKILSLKPHHTEYALTEKGRELVPILKNMIKWGEKYT